MAKSISTFTLSLLALALAGCGQGSVDPRIDPAERPDSPVVYSQKIVVDRVALLRDLLDAGLPPHLSDRAAKLSFFKKIAPAVVEAMVEGEAERAIALAYQTAERAGSVPAKLATEFSDLVARYSAKSSADLLERIDLVPLDMLFTQASIESGWGTSPVSHDCHNIFGVHAANAGQKCPGHPILAYYPDFTGSIKRYVLLLNTGGAFKKLRQTRAKLRESAGPMGALDSSILVEGLLPYSERGEAYVRAVAAGIAAANLDQVYRLFMQKIY